MSMRPPASRRVRTPAIALALLVIVQSGPGGLWILSWRGKRARYARCRLTPCRRRVSHNTLDAADGAHRLHRHFRRTLDQDVKIGSRRPVTLRHRKEGTDRASSLRSDERSRSPESAFTFAEIGVHGAACETPGACGLAQSSILVLNIHLPWIADWMLALENRRHAERWK